MQPTTYNITTITYTDLEVKRLTRKDTPELDVESVLHLLIRVLSFS